jgi:hypothetical protein
MYRLARREWRRARERLNHNYKVITKLRELNMQVAKKSFKSAGLCLAVAFAAATAGNVQAGAIFTPGLITNTDVENVRFNPILPGVVLGPSTTVTGSTPFTRYLVDFTSNESLIAFENPTSTPAVPPTVRATDGGLRSIDIDVRDGGYATLFYNLFVFTQGNGAGRFADILVTSFDGTVSKFQQQLTNGNNVMTIKADNTALLRGVSIFANTDFADIRQVRLGGLGDAEVPEPGMLWSFSLAGLALWGVRSRRRGSPRATGSDCSQA